MLKFSQYLREETEPFGKLKHLEHAEDHIIHPTEEGFHNAVNVLKQAHEHIKTGHSESKITTKYDGSPSIVFGHHPQTGKFFVATKSAFNKNPKVNYSEKDIEENHGHAPGLVAKLKEALHHLPKIAPKKGVYQGDLMYGHDDVKTDKTGHHFTPNTITYTAKKGTPEADKIAKSKIGLVVHTKYHGSHLEDMNAGFDPDTHNFKKHDDVNLINHEIDTSKVHHSPENEALYQHHIKKAQDEFKKAHVETFANTHGHEDHIRTYINKNVVTGDRPNAEGLKKHIIDRYKKDIDKVKTDKAKQKKAAELAGHINHIDDNKKQYESLFNMHHHLQQAKNALVSSLSSGTSFDHSVGGENTGPEGFVITHRGHPTKLVNRAEFSRQNFLKSKNRKAQEEQAN